MTPERAAYLKDYYETPRGKQVRAKALKKYNATPKARARRAEYQRTGKGRIATRRYTASYRGVLRAVLKRAIDRHNEKWPHDPSSLTHREIIELWRNQNGLCALSGIQMTWGQRRAQITSLSIDRVDNSRGYHLDNIRLICHGSMLFVATKQTKK